MNTINPGDRVTVTHDDGTTLPRRMVHSDEGHLFVFFSPNAEAGATVGIENFAPGWRIAEHFPATALPTEPGHYQDDMGRHWLHQVYNGSAYGAPERDTDQWLNPDGEIHPDPTTIPPLTRLFTAAEIIEWFEDRMTVQEFKSDTIRAARDHFGVTA